MSAPALSTFQNGLSQVSGPNLETFEQVCPTVSVLRGFIGAPGMQVYLQGTTTINDGGQGPFYWNVSGTGPDDGGATNVVPNGSTIGCWTRITFSSSLPVIANNMVLANIIGGAAAPTGVGLSALIDAIFGSTQGDVLYRDSSTWTILSPGTTGQLLSTGGAAANPSWVTASGTGTVTSIATNNGVTGGTITSSGTIGLSAVNNLLILSNITGAGAPPVANTLTAIIDAALGNTQGAILYRNASQWTVLNPGTSGQSLKTQGAGANPQWASSSAGSLVFLGSQTASTSASMDFTSLISSTYDDYELYLEEIRPASASILGLQFSVDNGSNYTTSGYAISQWTAAIGSAPSTANATSIESMRLNVTGVGFAGTTAAGAMSGKIYLFNMNSANSRQRAVSECFYDTGAGIQVKCVTAFNAGAAINAIRLIMLAGNITSGTARLYGIAKS